MSGIAALAAAATEEEEGRRRGENLEIVSPSMGKDCVAFPVTQGPGYITQCFL